MAGNIWGAIPGGKNPFTGSGGVLGSASSVVSAIIDPNFWKRAIEVIIGIIMLAVGLDKMTTSIPIATQIAKAVT